MIQPATRCGGLDQGVNDNKAIGEVVWCDLKNLVTEQLSGKALYVVDAFCGAEPKTRLRVRFITEVAGRHTSSRTCLSDRPPSSWQILNQILWS